MRGGSRSKFAAAGLFGLAALGAATGWVGAGTVTFTLDAPTLHSFLLAVTPYDVVVGKKGLSETVTLSNPRDVRFAGGAVRLRLDCKGTPLPIEEVIDFALGIRWNEVKRTFEARVETLPMKIPVLGSIDLAEYLRPITIPGAFSQSTGEGEQALGLEWKITSLRILDTMIQVGADLIFRRPAPPPPPAPSPTPATSGR